MSTRAKAFIRLAGAIVFEVAGTTCLKLSEGFTQPVYVVALAAAYGLSFLMLTYALKHLPVGLTYGIWGGAGTAFAAILGVVLWDEPFGWQLVVGTLLIMVGIGLISREPKKDKEPIDSAGQ